MLKKMRLGTKIINRINAVTLQVSQMATVAEQQTSTTVEISSNNQQITQVVQETAPGVRRNRLLRHSWPMSSSNWWGSSG
jgi:methyl-accepting chemotaxis protein